jgi:YVTN family beta-propeller protein
MRFSILGPLEVSDGDRDIPLGAGRQRKLLAILLLHRNEVVSTDRLIDELWGEHPPPTAAKALQGHISHLRKQLGQGCVLTVSAGYVLKLDPAELDAYRFEQLMHEAARGEPAAAARKLREALELWRGPPLADFAYDDFARREIDRLEGLRLTSIEKRIDADLALGRHSEVVPELEALVAEHPLREQFRAQLMLALYRSGRQAEALQAYHDGRAVLREELGLEPGEELQDLQKAILAHDPAVAAPPRVPLAGRRSPLVPAFVLRQPRLVAAVGVLLLGGAIALASIQLTGGSSSTVVLPNSVVAVDPKKGRVVSVVRVGVRPVAVAIGEGAVWVANADDGTIYRIDPKTRTVVHTIGVGADVSDLAIGFGSVWVADGNDGTVTRIDPRLNAPAGTLDLGARTLSPTPVFLVAVDGTHVWATRGSELLRIDPKTDAVDRRLRIPTPIGLATGGEAVWVTTLNDQLLRIDPRTAKVTTQAALPTQAIAPVFDHGSLWFILSLGRQIVRFDPNSLSPTAAVSLRGYPTDLIAGGGALWAITPDGSVSRIDPASTDVTAAVHIGGNPTAAAADAGIVWVAVAAPGATRP